MQAIKSFQQVQGGGVNQIFIGLVVVAGLIVSGYYYRSHQHSQELAAQTAFSICMQELDSALDGKASWQDVELASRAGYQQHRSAAIAPYFLAIHSQSLVQQDKRTEAVAVIDELLRSVGSKSPVYYVYAIKRSLLKLDIPDMQPAGLRELEDLAHDTANSQRDEALYYLAHYYEKNNNQTKAQELRKELASAYSQSGPAASPFAERIAQQEPSLVERENE